MFIIALIGMICSTSFASTQMMEQKQKATTFVVEQNYFDVVSVQPIDLTSIQFEATITNSYQAKTELDVPKEVVDSLTKIVLEFERTGKVPECNECRATCHIVTRTIDDNCIIYHFRCESGNNYYAVYTLGQVHVSEMFGYSHGVTLLPPHYPCRD